MSISVIIPAYKCSQYLERAVASVLRQPEVSEVVLVEDGSPDDTYAICQRCVQSDGRVQLYRHPGGENRGAAATRSLGLERASQPYLAFLDADDYYLPGRFARALPLLQAGVADGVYEAVVAQFESDAARELFMERRGWALTRRDEGITTVLPGILPERLFETLISGGPSFCHMNGLTLKSDLARSVGGFLPTLRLHQDLHFFFKVAYKGRLVAGDLEHPVAARWVHPGNRITQATPEVSQPYRRLLFRDLLYWAAAERMPLRLFQLILRRYLQLYARAFQGLALSNPINALLRRGFYAAHFVSQPKLSALVALQFLHRR